MPEEYHYLSHVFSKDHAQSLPPHPPYDCAKDLIHRASLLSSRLHQVSRLEQEALQEYITDSLATGLIRPTKSPLGEKNVLYQKESHCARVLITEA